MDEQIVETIKQWFERCDTEWLLVFDNVDNPDFEIDFYLPSGEKGNILITTRSHNFRRLADEGSDIEIHD